MGDRRLSFPGEALSAVVGPEDVSITDRREAAPKSHQHEACKIRVFARSIAARFEPVRDGLASECRAKVHCLGLGPVMEMVRIGLISFVGWVYFRSLAGRN